MSIEGIGSCDDYEAYCVGKSQFSKGIGGSVSAETDFDGNSKASAEVHASSKTESSGEFSGGFSGNVERKPDGSYSGNVEAKLSWEKNFSLFFIKV